MWPTFAEIPLPFKLLGADHLPIRAFGVMLVLAIVMAHVLWTKLAKKERYPQPVLDNFFLMIVVSIVVGARILYVITDWSHFRHDLLSIFAIQKGGMVFYGSFLGSVLGLWLFARWYKLEIWRFLDTCAAPTGLGLMIGRIGCLLVGDDYGKEVSASFPLAIKFSTARMPGSFLGITIPANNGNLAGEMAGKWLHPTQIYMSLNGLFLWVVISLIAKKRKFAGQLTAAFCMIYAINRSIIEEFRGDLDRGFVGPLSTSQFISIFVFLGGALIWATQRKKPLADPG